MKKEINVDGVSYRVTKQLGQGGQGTVLLAESEGQRYAIKTVQLYRENKKENKIKNDRLRKEVEYCRESHSQHIIQIISAEETNDATEKNVDGKQLHYVMPYYESTLRDWISKEKSIELKFNLLHQLYDAVSTIHADGIVHRDIKPENVLVDSKGAHLVLADFGIAHFSGSKKTLTKELLANRAYFAPEQMKGENQKDVGPAADVFALGLMTNELFTLQVPRGGSFTRIGDVYPLLSDLDGLVERMVCQNPDKRISIDSAESELKKISCTYRYSLTDAENLLRDYSTPSWEVRLEEIKQDVLDRKIAEKMLKGTGQQELDEFIALYVETPPQELSEAMKIRLKICDVQHLIDSEREKYTCEKILHRSSKQELQAIERGIYRQAAEEVILANQLLKTLSIGEWESINIKYHHNIRFCPNEDLLNAAQSIYFLEMCRNKFEYESNVYQSISGPNRQSMYDSGPTEEDRMRLDTWLLERRFFLNPITDSKTIHGEIRKYFISCGDYHCEELLKEMESIKEPWGFFSTEESALWLAYSMATHLISVANPQEDIRNRLDTFDLLDFIELSDVTDWPLEVFLEENEYARDLVLGPSLDMDGAVEILENLKKRFRGVNFEIRGSEAVVNFTDPESYSQFLHEAREKAKGHYFFEGEVIDILAPVFSGGELVQHIWSLGFDVKRTLAMVLGLREIE